MKILITGASGFIGSRLILAACDLYGSEKVLALSSCTNAKCKSIIYDGVALNIQKTDVEKIKQIDVIIHAGAFTPKNGNEANDIKRCNENIIFTENSTISASVSVKSINIHFSALSIVQDE